MTTINLDHCPVNSCQSAAFLFATPYFFSVYKPMPVLVNKGGVNLTLNFILSVLPSPLSYYNKKI